MFRGDVRKEPTGTSGGMGVLTGEQEVHNKRFRDA